MNNHIKIKMLSCLLVIETFIFLFPFFRSYADTIKGADGKEYTYSTEDDGSDGPDVATIPFELTGYGGETLATGYKDSDFTIDSKYGWRWYHNDEDGNDYVVVATASHRLFNAYKKHPEDYKSKSYMVNFGRKFEHIHYFNMNDVFYFTFANSDDTSIYMGIVLDVCGAATFPQDKAWKRGNDVNIIDIYFGKDAEKAGTEDNKRLKNSGISGKRVYLSMNGKFSKKANISKKSLGKIAWRHILNVFQLLFDGIHTLIGMTFTNVNYIEAGVYKKDYVKNLDEFKYAESGEISDAKFLSEHDISNVHQNSSGAVDIIFNPDSGIPIIQYDAYSLVAQDLDLFDINFITSNITNNNPWWKIVRKFVVSCTKVILYFSAAAFITILIWQGIRFVTSIYRDSPLGATEARNILQNSIIAIIRLIGIFIIIALTTNLYKVLRENILGEYTSNYLIRANIKDVYSFNTNVVGAIRIFTISTNIYQSILWTVIYFIATVIDVGFYALMFARMMAVGGLIIIAPIVAIVSLFETEDSFISTNSLLRFNIWIMSFMIIVWIPMLLLIILRILLRL